MTVTTNLPFPTADNTYITVDTINFTADGACLSNGGGQFISYKAEGLSRAQPTFSESAYLRF